jgi:hypothetical protein
LKERGVSPEWEGHYPVTTVVTPVQCVVAAVADKNLEDEGSDTIDDEERDLDGDGSESSNIDFFELDD